MISTGVVVYSGTFKYIIPIEKIKLSIDGSSFWVTESFFILLSFDFLLAYSISSVAYYPARVGKVLGSEHIYGGGLPLPSPTNSLHLGSDSI